MGNAVHAPLELPQDHIHIWLAFTDEAQDAALLTRYHALLSEDEHRQQQKFRFPEDAHRYLVTRALVRATLSRYASIAPEQWVFVTNAFGKPEIAESTSMAGKLSFNLSHTKGLVVLAVSAGTTLGVDVEQLRLPTDLMELAGATLTEVELQTLANLPAAQQVPRFFQYWTLKESYMKARGMGLEIPPKQVGVAFLPDGIRLVLDKALKDSAERWHVWQFRPTEDHCLALCAENTGAHKPQLVWRKTVPLASEQYLMERDFYERTPDC